MTEDNKLATRLKKFKNIKQYEFSGRTASCYFNRLTAKLERLRGSVDQDQAKNYGNYEPCAINRIGKSIEPLDEFSESTLANNQQSNRSEYGKPPHQLKHGGKSRTRCGKDQRQTHSFSKKPWPFQ